jgi:eukaryotic-like serine/threonine-protein kinase
LGATLGRGRLGSAVYRGFHRALRVPVAIRVLRRDEQPNWEAVRARFLLEARTLQIAHPNLLHIRDFGEDERLVYLVSDYIEGPSLHEELARTGAFPWLRAAPLVAQMLDAIASVNAHGGFIVGVNPQMIRLARSVDGDRMVMSTAGIASIQDVLATMREQELRGGEANERELPYVAPEVLLGQPPNQMADVFTAGVLAYQMVTGEMPYRAPSLPELIGQMLHARPTAPHSRNADVPEAASATILRALASQPASRPPTAEAFRRELKV